jgi:putative transposase
MKLPSLSVAEGKAARSFLARGQRVLACGEPVQQGRSVKQEPAEASQSFSD